jgi:hypothetical protein
MTSCRTGFREMVPATKRHGTIGFLAVDPVYVRRPPGGALDGKPAPLADWFGKPNGPTSTIAGDTRRHRIADLAGVPIRVRFVLLPALW